MTIREELLSMKKGSIKDVIYSNGIARSTKQLERIDDDEFFVHDFSCGWETASLTTEEAVLYVKGKLESFDLEWF
jgi:hypothetical protein